MGFIDHLMSLDYDFSRKVAKKKLLLTNKEIKN